jgi:NADH:ubiquinone oxidoreductase subunit H
MVGFFFSYLISLVKLIILFLILTIVIATVTLIERKILALIQRRVGPNYIGYKGRLQFIADALKLLFKHITVINKTNKLLFIIIPALVLIVSYLF